MKLFKDKRTISIFASIFFGFIIVGTIMLNGKYSEPPQIAILDTKFEVINPIVTDTSYHIEYIADIHAINYVDVVVKAPGFIEKIHVDEGQVIRKGDLILSINKQEIQTQVLEARANYNGSKAELKSAEIELLNTKDLVNKNIISERQLAKADANILYLQAKVEEAKSLLERSQVLQSYTQVKSPIDGVVGRINKKTGSYVEENEMFTTVTDNSRIYAYFNISENEYLNIVDDDNYVQNAKATLILANHNEFGTKGNVETVGSRVNIETGTLSFRANFENPNQILRHGSTAKIRLEKQVDNAVLVPKISTVESQDQLYVFTVNDNNIVTKKKITVENRLSHHYIVKSGLNEDDRIVYKGLQLLHSGLQIEPETSKFSKDRKLQTLMMSK